MRAGRVEIDAESHILTPVADTKATPKIKLNQFYIQEIKWETMSQTT